MRGIKRLLIESAYMLAVFFFFGISALANGTINTGTIHHDGIERTYEYYVPSSYDESQPTELLFSFHGLGSDAPGQRSLTNFEAIAEKEGFIAVFPNATRLENDVGVPLPDLSNSEVQWNDGRKDSVQNYKGIDDVGFVSTLIDTFMEEFNIDENRVYATGMSNGAMFSQRLAIELSDRFAAVASVTGGIPSEEYFLTPPKRPVPVIFILGDEDGVVKYELSAPSVGYWVQHNGTATEPVRETLPKLIEDDPTVIHKEVYGNGKLGSEVILYTVEGGGHTWPGGPQYAPVETIGLVSGQMNASAVIWEHFKNYSMNQVEDEDEDDDNGNDDGEPGDNENDGNGDDPNRDDGTPKDNGTGSDDEKKDNGKDKSGDDDKGGAEVIPKKEEKNEDGGKLPVTATNMYTYLIIGAIMTAVAIAFFIYRKKRLTV